MNLYQFPLSPNCQKVVAIAHEVGMPITLINLDVFRGGAKTSEMLAKNPNGRIPVLEDGDFVLWESNAMLGYIATKANRTDLALRRPTTSGSSRFEANGRPAVAFYREDDDGVARFFALQVLELDRDGVRTIDHFMAKSGQRALFAAGLPPLLHRSAT